MINAEPTTTKDGNLTQAKIKKYCDFVKSYFPITEESTNYAIPSIGFMLSGFIIIIYVIAFSLENQFLCAFVIFCYLVLTGAPSIELYFCLKQQKTKQHYTLWLLMKTIEVLLLCIATIYEFLRPFWYYWADYNAASGELALLILDLLVMGYVIKRSSNAPEESTMETGNKIANMNEYSKVGIY